MLNKEETDAVIASLERWPGGMGCVLIPDASKKRGYKNADWGFNSKGHKFGNFNYEDLKEMPEDALYCPVTRIGLMRGAKDYKDHNAAYKDIIFTLEIAIKEAELGGLLFGNSYTEVEIKKFYNNSLRNAPSVLKGWFMYYHRMLEKEERSERT